MLGLTRGQLIRLLAAFGATLALPTITIGQQSTKIRVGVLKIAGQTNAYVSQREGYFKKRGLDVELTFIRSGAEGVSAMQGRSLDMVITIPAFGIVANERGLDLAMVIQNQVAAMTPPDTGAMLIASELAMQFLKELEELIGINARHAQEVVSVQSVMVKAGVPRKSIRYIEIPYASMGDVLKRGEVAAVVTVEPFVTTIQQRGQGKVISWAYNAAIPGQPTGAYFAKKDWVRANAKAVALYAEAIDEANAYLSDPDKARAAVAEYTGLAPDLVAAMPLIPWTTKVDKDKWTALITMLQSEEEIKKPQRPEDFIWSLMNEKRS